MTALLLRYGIVLFRRPSESMSACIRLPLARLLKSAKLQFPGATTLNTTNPPVPSGPIFSSSGVIQILQFTAACKRQCLISGHTHDHITRYLIGMCLDTLSQITVVFVCPCMHQSVALENSRQQFLEFMGYLK